MYGGAIGMDTKVNLSISTRVGEQTCSAGE